MFRVKAGRRDGGLGGLRFGRGDSRMWPVPLAKRGKIPYNRARQKKKPAA